MKIYKVKIKYEGTDGYGYGIKRTATRTFKFKSLNEAKSYVPGKISVVEGHGVYTILAPIKVEIFEIEMNIKRL